jgi:2-polyprenyl-3-methyl-5-hydroxy-6-metoxy-1,4-benzoquinol methylase
MDQKRITSKFIHSFLEKIGVKLDPYKIKKYVDFSFIIIEKAIVNLQKLQYVYFDFYSDIIKNEIALAGISKDKKILHIGCGPIPATSILIAKKTDAQITCIDKDPNSIKKATLCVSYNGLSEKINVVNSNAESFAADDYDIIIVSQGVNPIKKILNLINKSIKDDACVIYRTSFSPSGDISKEDVFIKDIFNIKKIVAQKKNALMVSILLVKK